MDEYLAEKEKKYHKLNLELERRTKELMKDVESVCEKMNLNFSETHTNGCSEGKTTEKFVGDEKLCDNLNKEKYTLKSFVNNTQIKKYDNKRPHSFAGLIADKYVNKRPHSFAGLIGDNSEVFSEKSESCTFLKTKTYLLQNELHEVKCLYSEKVKEHSNLLAELKKIEKELSESKISLLKMKDLKETCERNYELVVNKLKIHQNKNKYLQEEVNSLNRELSHTKKKDAQQLKQLLGEIERLNNSLTKKVENNKFLRDDIKKNEITKSQKDNQSAEAIILLKKQLQLVANLKKQKYILETINPVKLSESKFLKIFNFEP